MPHYVCTGTCGGVAQIPGACQAQDCPRHNELLAECFCQDGEHREAKDGSAVQEKQ